MMSDHPAEVLPQLVKLRMEIWQESAAISTFEPESARFHWLAVSRWALDLRERDRRRRAILLAYCCGKPEQVLHTVLLAPRHQRLARKAMLPALASMSEERSLAANRCRLQNTQSGR